MKEYDIITPNRLVPDNYNCLSTPWPNNIGAGIAHVYSCDFMISMKKAYNFPPMEHTNYKLQMDDKSTNHWSILSCRLLNFLTSIVNFTTYLEINILEKPALCY